MISTNSPDLAEKVKVLRNHGSEVRYHHSVIGFNSRLDEIQAVVLRAKLKHIGDYNEGRRRVAHLYSELLQGSVLTPPAEDGKGVHVYHQYTVLTDNRDVLFASDCVGHAAATGHYSGRHAADFALSSGEVVKVKTNCGLSKPWAGVVAPTQRTARTRAPVLSAGPARWRLMASFKAHGWRS